MPVETAITGPTDGTHRGHRYRTNAVWANIESGSGFSISGNVLSIYKNWDGADYDAGVLFLSFDTRLLGTGATINSASLWLTPHVAPDITNSPTLLSEYYDWGGTLDNADWTLTCSNSIHTAVALSTFTIDVPKEIVLTDLSGISGEAITRIRCTLNDFGTPTGLNQLQVKQYLYADSPKLVVNYDYASPTSAYSLPPTRIY